MGAFDLIFGGITEIADKFIPDANERLKFKKEIAELAQATEQRQHELTLAQLAINKVEAASASLFKSGWRPAIGWICALGFFYEIILVPILPWSINLSREVPIAALPSLGDNFWQALWAILGFGAFRTFEKIKGVASK